MVERRVQEVSGAFSVVLSASLVVLQALPLILRAKPQTHGKYIVDGDKVSNVVKIQTNREISEVVADASIAAFREYLSLARSTASEMMLATIPSALGENSYIIMTLVKLSEL